MFSTGFDVLTTNISPLDPVPWILILTPVDSVVRIKSGSAFHNSADRKEKRIKSRTGCSRFIEGQNVISVKNMGRRTERKLTYISYTAAGKSF